MTRSNMRVLRAGGTRLAPPPTSFKGYIPSVVPLFSFPSFHRISQQKYFQSIHSMSLHSIPFLLLSVLYIQTDFLRYAVLSPIDRHINRLQKATETAPCCWKTAVFLIGRMRILNIHLLHLRQHILAFLHFAKAQLIPLRCILLYQE